MNSFYYDIFLTLFTFVLLGILSFRAMRVRSARKDGPNDGGINLDKSPKIDLPPGVIWPSEPPILKKNKEEFLF